MKLNSVYRMPSSKRKPPIDVSGAEPQLPRSKLSNHSVGMKRPPLKLKICLPQRESPLQQVSLSELPLLYVVRGGRDSETYDLEVVAPGHLV